MGIGLIVAFVAAGRYALPRVYYRASRDRQAASMPSFLGILPGSWRRWVLGEERERSRR